MVASMAVKAGYYRIQELERVYMDGKVFYTLEFKATRLGKKYDYEDKTVMFSRERKGW